MIGADLVLVGRVLTGDSRAPHAEAVAIRGNRVTAVGTAADVLKAAGPRANVVGDRSCGVVPGFVDSHLHFVALARRAADVDCSRERAASIAEVLDHVAAAAAEAADGAWIRAFGYDEALLAERRSPTPAELERAAPRHPVRLLHRTGHAAVLNRRAFERLGLAPRDTILEPGELLRGKLPPPEPKELRRLAARASERLLAAGVTSFHDVTPGQDRTDFDRLREWTASRTIAQRVVAYGDPLSFGFAGEDADRFAAPGVKIVVTDESDADEVAARVAEADGNGAQIALHAVEGGPLIIAVAALAHLGAARVRARRHRIEHASLCPPALCDDLATCGATVVTHPRFLSRFGAKYRRELVLEEREWLYPLRAFREAGVPVALGSDAPIAPAEPLANIAAATLREDEDGEPLGASQRISAAEALAMHTEAGAALAGSANRLGALVPGRLADAVLLEADPTSVASHEIAAITVRATIVDGEVVWSR